MPEKEPVPPFTVERGDGVVTIRFLTAPSLQEIAKDEVLGDGPFGLGILLEQLRWDNEVRVIVLTGAEDGAEFMPTETFENYGSDYYRQALGDVIDTDWAVQSGATRTMQVLALMEKPVIARVNGDCTQWAQSVALGCDLVVAWEEAIFADVHMAIGDVTHRDGTRVGTPYPIVPGDGAMAWVPLMMSPPLAKEYFILARPFTGRQFADMGIINYAVGLDELDGVTEKWVDGIKRRSARAVAYTKRAVNKNVVQQMNLALDAAHGYELVNIYDSMRHWAKHGTERTGF